VASLASRGASIRPHKLHALLELAFVRIAVAAGAVQVGPPINDGWFRLEFCRLFVAVSTWDREVSAGQHKVSLPMLGQSEGRRLVSL